MSTQDPQMPPPGWEPSSTDGQPGGQSFDQSSFQPEQKSNPVTRIIIIVVAVAFVGAGGYFAYKQFAQDAALKPGKCVVETGEGSNVDAKEVDCDDKTQNSLYVAKVLSGQDTKKSCEAGDEKYALEITKTVKNSSTPTDRYCLQPNLHQDNCYKVSDSENEIKMVSCDNKTEEVLKVVAKIKGKDQSCSDESIPLSLSPPGGHLLPGSAILTFLPHNHRECLFYGHPRGGWVSTSS